MATYVNNLRLTEITTGDESGTWGTTTNANWDFVTDAFGYGVKNMASDADVTYTMADGSVDTLRSMYLKITSGVSLSATRTITIAPNTVSKIWIIENATTGSQSITIAQGSGATVTIANGNKAMVYSDGAGAGAAVVLSNPTVSLTAGVTGQLPLANGGTGANLTDPNADRILFWDDSAGAVTWLEAGSGLSISGTTITATGSGGTVTSVSGTGTVAGITLTGTVTTSGNLTLGGTLSVDLTTMVTGDLPYSNLAQGSALSVLGVTGNATADVASIAAGTDHQVLRRSGTSLAFGAVNLAQAAAITGTLPVGNGGTGITSLGTGVATWLGTPSSANLASAVTDETGSGALVFATAPSLSGAVLNDGYTEEVYAIPSSTTPALSPTNGSIQTWTLTGASTPTAGTWAAGQSMTLMIDDGTAYTITWTSVLAAGNWIGGSAPTLATSGYTVIELWKVGSTIYGALVGSLT